MDRSYRPDRPPATAIRISAACPLCRGALRLRRRREDAGLFLGCSSYPRCTWAEDYDGLHAALLERIRELESEIAALLEELRSLRDAERATPALDVARELRGLIALAHPDRWPHAADLAHELTSRLTDLRRRCAG